MGPEPEKMERPIISFDMEDYRKGCRIDELQAEVALLTEENKRLKGDQIEIEFSEKDTSKLFGDMNETIARLTEENEKFKGESVCHDCALTENAELKKANEKLRDDLGLTMSEERKLRTENAEQLARISELEEQLEIEKAGRAEALNSAEYWKQLEYRHSTRISAIEKDLSKHFSAHQMSFKPGGE